PEVEARPVGPVRVPAPVGVEPWVGKEHREHLLAAAVPQAQAPGARPPRSIAVAEECRASASAPARQLGRRRQRGRAVVRADAEVKVPRLLAFDLDREIAIQERHAGCRGEPPLEDGALDARAEDHAIPVLLEDLFQQSKQRRLSRLEVEELGAGSVEIVVRDHRTRAHGSARPRDSLAWFPASATSTTLSGSQIGTGALAQVL